MHRYRIERVIGDGTYGEVLQASHATTQEVVAVKRLKRCYGSQSESEDLAEVQALRRLCPHQNVVQLRDVIHEPLSVSAPSRGGVVYLVFEHMRQNLYELISSRRSVLPESRVRKIMLQILQGVCHIHSKGLFHRDLKPENILVSGDMVKVADFGLARETSNPRPCTDYVSTRWYRAPEVLVQSQTYGPAIDMWACGAIMAELYTLQPLFPGKSELDEVQKISAVIGAPTLKTWPEGLRMARQLGIRYVHKTPKRSLSELIPGASQNGINLISQLIRYNPSQRITARAALQHPFFRQQGRPGAGRQPSNTDQASGALVMAGRVARGGNKVGGWTGAEGDIPMANTVPTRREAGQDDGGGSEMYRGAAALHGARLCPPHLHTDARALRPRRQQHDANQPRGDVDKKGGARNQQGRISLKLASLDLGLAKNDQDGTQTMQRQKQRQQQQQEQHLRRCHEQQRAQAGRDVRGGPPVQYNGGRGWGMADKGQLREPRGLMQAVPRPRTPAMDRRRRIPVQKNGAGRDMARVSNAPV